MKTEMMVLVLCWLLVALVLAAALSIWTFAAVFVLSNMGVLGVAFLVINVSMVLSAIAVVFSERKERWCL